MSERKVLNKYYPPDFDPSKIPKLRQPKTRQYTIRTMAPFNMRCNTCGDYIYKGRKFNAKCETAEDDNYLGLRIYRFYIRCPKCISEIMFKTDLENTDYTLEHGAKRLFEAQKLLEEAEKREQKQLEEDSTNPMKMLENRTKDSKLEMEIMENLEELRELNTRKADLDYTEILRLKAEEAEAALQRQEEEDEEEIRRIFGKDNEKMVKRLQDSSDSDSEDTPRSKSSLERSQKRASDFLVEESSSLKKQKTSSKSALAGLVKLKSTSKSLEPQATAMNSSYQIQKTSAKIDPVTRSENSSKNFPTNDNHLQTISSLPKSEMDVLHKEKLQNNVREEREQPPVEPNVPDPLFDQLNVEDSIMEGMARASASASKKETVKAAGFGLLVGYDDSDESDVSSDG